MSEAIKQLGEEVQVKFKEIQELQAQMDILSLKDIEEKWGHMVGKYYKGKNSFTPTQAPNTPNAESAPTKSWHMYINVLELNGRDLKVRCFEQRPDGTWFSSNDLKLNPDSMKQETLQEINPDEYRIATDDFIGSILSAQEVEKDELDKLLAS